MTEDGKSHIPPTLLEDAAIWHARLSSGEASDADIEQHMEWLLADPLHADAFEQVTAAMRAAGSYETAARDMFADDFKVSSAPSWSARLFGGWGWPQAATAVAAAAALLFFAVTPTLDITDPAPRAQIYAAADSVTVHALSDGSTLSLFAGSEATVTMADERRTVDLESGRAFFDVTSDPARPFQVRTATREVTVVGTRFEVIRGAGFDQIAVNEGLVSVATRDDEQDDPLLIEPGDRARYSGGTNAPVVDKVAVATIGMWAEGILVFRDEALPAVIGKIQTLFPDRAIVIDGEALEGLTFSGTLVVSDVDQMVRQLADFLNLDVDVAGATIRLSDK